MANKPKSVAKDTKSMMSREIEFMMKNKAPKSMIKHEKAEYKSSGKKK